MWDNLKDYHIILGSQSPRRVQLLGGLGIAFEQYAMPEIDESYPENLPPEEVALYIAEKKAKAYAGRMQDNTLLITADTVVIDSKDRILGKPADPAEAKSMLQCLSDSTHRVVTGVVIATPGHREKISCISKVTFGALTDEQIDYYLSNFAPLDKAGAYGIQEWIGYVAIKHIEGSFYNVMGLPVYQVAHTLMLF
ncbi:septum formation inhibitor Maf [Porphyromonas macacae]|uniref:Maf family nucleotide pyrophosphatase n=1 Tax=Porphyromonas macacae TaxID=28115 RepID=UPI00052C709D|nr:Maf family nucleotide pyrophosphatase [Porphyromonas macacae]KGN97673.1 septum formation inhibitor Maf [Porphyromonas macacae]